MVRGRGAASWAAGLRGLRGPLIQFNNICPAGILAAAHQPARKFMILVVFQQIDRKRHHDHGDPLWESGKCPRIVAPAWREVGPVHSGSPSNQDIGISDVLVALAEGLLSLGGGAAGLACPVQAAG
jgi:hypothetical protein